MSKSNEIYERIFDVVRGIKEGEVATYGGVAREAGLANGARQVGYAMRVAQKELPWHRVVGFSRKGLGKISIGDPMVADLQRTMLESEGVKFNAQGEIYLNFSDPDLPNP